MYVLIVAKANYSSSIFSGVYLNISFQCLIAANYICKKLYDRGEFSFYSGSGIKNADNEILFHLPNKVDHEKMRNLHVNITLQNGCWRIQSLDDNDVGIVYIDHHLDCSSLKKIIEKRSML